MAITVTRPIYGDAKRILKGHDVKSSSFLTDLSETTLRRIRKSKSYANYKELMKLDNPARKASSRKQPKQSTGRVTSSTRTTRIRVSAPTPTPKATKKPWYKRLVG